MTCLHWFGVWHLPNRIVSKFRALLDNFFFSSSSRSSISCLLPSCCTLLAPVKGPFRLWLLLCPPHSLTRECLTL